MKKMKKLEEKNISKMLRENSGDRERLFHLNLRYPL